MPGVDIPSLVGGRAGYVGFTAGTGGLSATQTIQGWTYSPTVASRPPRSTSPPPTTRPASTPTARRSPAASAAPAPRSRRPCWAPSQTWNGLTFNLGPAGANDLVQALGQSVTLPQGRYSSLSLPGLRRRRQLSLRSRSSSPTPMGRRKPSPRASAIGRPRRGTPASPRPSRWPTRTSPTGRRPTRARPRPHTYLYGYTFALNNSKTVKSLTLPNQGGIHVAALDLS